MNLNSSHSRGWEEDAVIHNKLRNVWEPYHTQTHLDCLVRPQPSLPRMQSTGFLEDSQTYISNKFPKLCTMTLPGFNKAKIHNNTPIPSGLFAGYTPRKALLTFSRAQMAALIFGSNDHKWLFSLTTEEAIIQYLKLIKLLFNGTCFKVLFISTIFPRQEFYKQGVISPALQAFNDALIGENGKYLCIKNLNGEEVKLSLRIVNMTSIFKYKEMNCSKFYCSRSRDGTHLKGIYSERYLEQLFSTIKNYSKVKAKQEKLRRRRETAVNSNSAAHC